MYILEQLIQNSITNQTQIKVIVALMLDTAYDSQLKAEAMQICSMDDTLLSTIIYNKIHGLQLVSKDNNEG